MTHLLLIRSLRVCLLCCFISLTTSSFIETTCAQVDSKPPTPTARIPQTLSLTEWLCKNVVGNAPCEWLKKLGDRDEFKITKGDCIKLVYLNTRKSELLWKCDGCWSPYITKNQQLLFVREDGIYRLGLPASKNNKAERVIEARSVIRILGSDLNDSNCLYFLREEATSQKLILCKYLIQTKSWQDLQTLELKVIQLSEMTLLTQINNNKLVDVGKFMKVSRECKWLIITIPDGNSLHSEPVFSDYESKMNTISQSDPIWLPDGSGIVYIEGNLEVVK